MHGAFQPDALHRFPHHGAHGAAMPHGFKTVGCARCAQHADVFVIHAGYLVPAQPQRKHPRLGKRRKLHGIPAHLVQDSGCHLGGGLVHALVLFQQRTHKIVDLNGRMRHGGKTAVPVRRELGNVVVAAVQSHAFGVGEHPAGRGNAAGQVAQCHAGRDFQHDV